jgi:DNA-binding Lrp family transcriptional regulator
VTLDPIDKAILNRIQSDFPVAARPFQAIAAELGLTEIEVIERVRSLKQSGVIRRIGGNFVPGKVGFVSTLCAARVPEDRIDQFAEVVNRYIGVTHNYVRDNDRFNIWFTFIAASREEIAAGLARITEETGIAPILNLPATHVFKIKAEFEV